MSSHTEQNKAEAYKLTLADIEKMGKQKHKVLKAFADVPYNTRRELAEKTGIEISSLCRILKDFESKDVVRIPFSITCKTTGHMVACYTTSPAIDSLLMEPEVWIAVKEGAE
ncbi:putative DNA binding transcriptional regulator MarR family [Ralstonia phage phiAp1]|uniref:Putative DNA binding transcriptional regulator MarR family n=1 Tax=Ralstonia phage phiAp1 TaxID=2783867 RepID=A0A1L7DS43_9CAUD|nr:putative DNA binding transcriptional regulator MarR family [Ralstonia phage phiAp1]APU03161.1 putative DNA binding transcriptional regulator MarR family [Ralstonia phage phiAp1]